jgi:adenine C2-methylase RlmN of 23S rRNA A2503 and tRNA A37
MGLCSAIGVWIIKRRVKTLSTSGVVPKMYELAQRAGCGLGDIAAITMSAA